MYRPLLSLLLLPLFSLPASAAGLTERQACLKLISTAHALRLAGPDKRGDYRCRRHATDADFVFTLRFDGPKEPDDAIHLLGYYAVDPATRDIYEWDITLQKRGAVLVVPQRKKR
jgi:hypothetical protein